MTVVKREQWTWLCFVSLFLNQKYLLCTISAVVPCSFTQSQAGAQMVRKRGRFWLRRTPGVLQQSSYGLLAQAPSVPPITSLLPFFQLQETQLKDDKEYKMINLGISYIFHSSTSDPSICSPWPGWRYKSVSEYHFSFHPYTLWCDSSLSLALGDFFTYRYTYKRGVFNQERGYGSMFPSSDCSPPSPQRQAPLLHAEPYSAGSPSAAATGQVPQSRWHVWEPGFWSPSSTHCRTTPGTELVPCGTLLCWGGEHVLWVQLSGA